MSVFVLALTLLHPQNRLDSLAPLEGVWFDQNGSPAFIGNGRVDWKTEDRYYTARFDPVPDGSLLGSFLAGRDLFIGLYATDTSTAPDTSRQPLGWTSDASATYYSATDRRNVTVSVPHLGPDPRTFVKPAGEARIVSKTLNARGVPAVVELATVVSGSHTPVGATYVRGMDMASLTLSGTFGDKDVTVLLDGENGRVGSISGTLTYLGKRYSLSGKRIMGRAGILLFDDSRLGIRGAGYVAWAPSPDRVSKIENRDSTSTDRIDVYFRVGDGSTATGIHKSLKRAS